jgi:Flp pilus assembly protein TadD
MLALNLYRTLGNSGQRAEAERFGSDWLRRHPDDPGMHYTTAVSAIQRSDLAGAEPRLRRTLELQPNHALAMNDLAWILLEQDKPGALPLARRAAELQPRQPRIMDTLALAMAAEGDLTGALKVQKEAVQLDPGSMELRLTLAKIAARAGDAALARSELDRLSALGTRFKHHAEVAELRKRL